MKFIGVLKLLLISFAIASCHFSNKNEEVLLQKDLYLKENSCGKSKMSFHNVLVLKFKLSQSIIANHKIHFKVFEKLTQSEQKIELHKDYYFYPIAFEGSPHYEYNMPECDNSECEINLFVYSNLWKNLRDKLDLSIDITYLETGKKIREIKFEEIKNNFFDQENELIPRLKMDYIKESQMISAVVDKKEIDYLRKIGVSTLNIVLQWREHLEEHGYREFEVYQDIRDENSFKIEHRVNKEPTYVSGYLAYDNSHLIVESKTVIQNEKDDFFKCLKQ